LKKKYKKKQSGYWDTFHLPGCFLNNNLSLVLITATYLTEIWKDRRRKKYENLQYESGGRITEEALMNIDLILKEF